MENFDFGLVVVLVFGLILVYLGGNIMFSDRLLQWIYKKGIWKHDNMFGEVEGKKYDSYVRGGRFFFVGIVIVAMTVWTMFFI